MRGTGQGDEEYGGERAPGHKWDEGYEGTKEEGYERTRCTWRLGAPSAREVRDERY